MPESANHPIAATVEVIAGVVIVQHGKVLLVQEKQSLFYGKWNFPAGHVDIGETIEEAAVREAKEEAGYDVELDQAFDVIHESIDQPVLHAFAAHIVGGKLQFPENEILAVKWFTIAEVRTMVEELRSAKFVLGCLEALEATV
jgi:ADP-ribose pyrophosphatase YjhB (NUDIX family)